MVYLKEGIMGGYVLKQDRSSQMHDLRQPFRLVAGTVNPCSLQVRQYGKGWVKEVGVERE